MSELLNFLAAKAATLTSLEYGVAGVLVTLFCFVALRGGLLTVQDWLAGLDTKRRDEAEQLLLGAVDSHEGDPRKRVALLLEGLDRWGELSALARERSRDLALCKWSALALILGGGALGFFQPCASPVGVILTAVWLWLLATLLIRLAPILLLVLHHGVPQKPEGKRVHGGNEGSGQRPVASTSEAPRAPDQADSSKKAAGR